MSLVVLGQLSRVLVLKNKVHFFSIRVSIQRIFLKIQTLHFARVRYTQYKFGCDWTKLKGTLPVEQSTFSLCVGFCSKDFPETSYLAPHLLVLQTL
jgi:hypothetical protein